MSQITIILIVTPAKCGKCYACEDLVKRLQGQFPDQIVYREFTSNDAEAEQFGVVLPPMLIVDDFLAAAGNVPDYDALAKLVAAKLEAKDNA